MSLTSYQAAAPRGMIAKDAFGCGAKESFIYGMLRALESGATFGQSVSPPPCSTGASRLKGIGVMTTRAPTPTVS